MKKITAIIIFADNLLNWFLGISLTLFPGWFASLIAPQWLAPRWMHVVVGLGFVWFAWWQVQEFLQPLLKKSINGSWLRPDGLRQAAIMAWWPVVVLTIVLLLPLAQPLYPTARMLLWIGDGYMLVLGSWYWWVAKRV